MNNMEGSLEKDLLYALPCLVETREKYFSKDQ